MAIYAAETMDEVIPFALPIRWYPDNPSGKRAFECENGLVKDYWNRIEISEEAMKIHEELYGRILGYL